VPDAVLAQAPAQSLAQWHHTAWTARDGLNGQPRMLAQTADGFLWIGTTAGLFRFDGRPIRARRYRRRKRSSRRRVGLGRPARRRTVDRL
jgi:ligand-binding sensor domain-containing protein